MLRSIRTEADNERHQSASILEMQEITKKKKEIDKLVLQSINLAIRNGDEEKVLHYLDLLNFTVSLKAVIQLCNKSNADQLARRVSMFISEKDTREMHEMQVQQMTSKITSQRNDSTQVSKLLKINENKVALDSNGKIDLGSLSMNNRTPQNIFVE